MHEAYTARIPSRHPEHSRPDMQDRRKAPLAILFDLDGTLIDSYRLYLEAYGRALEPILGRRPSREEIAARRPSAERRFLEDWVGAAHVDSCHDALCTHYAELQGALGEGVYEGVREMLLALSSAGYPLGIVTGKGRRIWEITAPLLPAQLFRVVVTEDDVDHPKPDPAGVLLAAEALQVEPKRTVYVGDSHSDLAAAERAGALSAAALWAKTDPEDHSSFVAALASDPPDFVYASPADLTRQFARWC